MAKQTVIRFLFFDVILLVSIAAMLVYDNHRLEAALKAKDAQCRALTQEMMKGCVGGNQRQL